MSCGWHRIAARRARGIAARLAPHLPRSGCALDIGSGTGHNAEALRRDTGLDLVETDVVDFHVVGPGPVPCGDGRLPFADDRFDGAIVCHVLQFSADPAALLREAARVARRIVVLQSTGRGAAGRLFLAARGFLRGRLAFHAARATGFIPHVACPMPGRRVLSPDDLLAAAAAAGLRVAHAERTAARAGVALELLVLERAS